MSSIYFAKGCACFDAPNGAESRLGGSEDSLNVILDKNKRILTAYIARQNGSSAWAEEVPTEELEDMWREFLGGGSSWRRPGINVEEEIWRFERILKIKPEPKPLGRSASDRICGVRGE